MPYRWRERSVAKGVLLFQTLVTIAVITLFFISYVGEEVVNSFFYSILTADIAAILLHMTYRGVVHELNRSEGNVKNAPLTHIIISFVAIITTWRMSVEITSLSSFVLISGLWMASLASGVRIYREKYLEPRAPENPLSK